MTLKKTGEWLISKIKRKNPASHPSHPVTVGGTVTPLLIIIVNALKYLALLLFVNGFKLTFWG